jgi:hypothetical protein
MSHWHMANAGFFFFIVYIGLRLGVWLKWQSCKALSSNPSTAKKKGINYIGLFGMFPTYFKLIMSNVGSLFPNLLLFCSPTWYLVSSPI